MSLDGNFEFRQKDYIAEDVVEECMTEYSIDVAAQKVVSAIDGLKSGYRRILWSVRNQDKKIGLNTFVGKVISIHPVGDRSINDSCIRSMQEHSLGIPLLEGQGNTGSYDNEDSGANRYLKVAIHPFAKDLYFEGVNLRTIPMKETEDFMDIEPIYLISRLPATLLMYALTIGSGFKSETFPINIDNVCTLVQRYVEHQVKNPGAQMNYEGMEHLIVPDFPIKNTIRNFNEIITSFKKKEYSPQIVVEGLFDVSPGRIVLRTSPFSVPFETIEDKLRKLLADKKSWISDLYNGFSNLVSCSTEGALSITFKRGVDVFDVANKLQAELGITKGLRAIPKFVNRNGGLITLTPFQLLELWYKVRKSSVIAGIKSDQVQNIRQIIERQTKLLVHDRLDEVFTILRDKNLNQDQVVEKLENEFDLSRFRARILINTPIISANTNTRDKIEEEIDILEKKAIQLKESLKSSDDVIYRDAEYFKKKYGKPRRTKISQYLGYVCISGKYIHMVDTVDEAKTILNNFPDSTVHMYPDRRGIFDTTHVIYGGNLTKIGMTLPPRITCGERIVYIPSSKPKTVCITKETASIAEGVIYPNDGSTTHYVGDKFTGIFSDGEVQCMSSRDLKVRKGQGKRGTKSSLMYVIPSQYGEVVLVHMNKIDPTSITLSRINKEIKKIPLSLMDETEFLGIIPVLYQEGLLFNLPDWVSGTAKYISIPNPQKLISKIDTNITVTISRKSVRDYDLRTAILL